MKMYRELNFEMIEKLKFNNDGLVPVTVIDTQFSTPADLVGKLVMNSWSNDEALQMTIEERLARFWSRSRSDIWRVGEVSGQIMPVEGVYVNCGLDAVAYGVLAPEAACHTGAFSCFELPGIGE